MEGDGHSGGVERSQLRRTFSIECIESQAEVGERLTEYIMSRGRTGQSHTSSHLTLDSRQDTLEREETRRFFINWSSERIIFLFLYSLTEEYWINQSWGRSRIEILRNTSWFWAKCSNVKYCEWCVHPFYDMGEAGRGTSLDKMFLIILLSVHQPGIIRQSQPASQRTTHQNTNQWTSYNNKVIGILLKSSLDFILTLHLLASP